VGFYKAPEKTVRSLDDEPKNEIVKPLDSPTQVNSYTPPVVNETTVEPFLKNELVEPTANVQNVVEPAVNTLPVTEEPFLREEKADDNGVQFNWEISSPAQVVENTTVTPEPEPVVEKVVRHVLEDDNNEKVNLDTVTAKSILSPEEQQRRNQERLSKIQDYTSKLKKAEGITEFENEPAYVRRNIQLDNSQKSTQETVSRFGLTEDETGTSLRNNNFLHDNVD
jgi:cell division protein FtsZ